MSSSGLAYVWQKTAARRFIGFSDQLYRWCGWAGQISWYVCLMSAVVVGAIMVPIAGWLPIASAGFLSIVVWRFFSC